MARMAFELALVASTGKEGGREIQIYSEDSLMHEFLPLLSQLKKRDAQLRFISVVIEH